jgi:glutamine amidotransferase
MLGFLSREPIPIRRYLVEAPRGLLHMSLHGKKAPHRDGFGYAYRNTSGRMAVHRWGKADLDRVPDGLPGDLDPSTTLLIAHVRKASPEYGARLTDQEAHPFAVEGLLLAHNGTIRDAETLDAGAGIDSQRIARWLSRAWQPRTLEALARALGELLARVRDYTAVNLLFTEGASLYAFCCYTQDQDYYTLWYRVAGEAVIVASEPVDDGPSWQPLSNGELLHIRSELNLERLQVRGLPSPLEQKSH